MKKVALITGVTGQDSSYLAEFLLKKILKWKPKIEFKKKVKKMLNFDIKNYGKANFY